MGTIEYLTARRTIVTTKRRGRPPKEPRKGSLEIVGQHEGFALIDGCVPIALAKAFKQALDALNA